MQQLGVTSCELWELHVEPRELRRPENRERLHDRPARPSRTRGCLDPHTSSPRPATTSRVAQMSTVPLARYGAIRHAGGDARLDPNEFATPDDFARAIGSAARRRSPSTSGHMVAANHDPLAYLRANHERIVTVHLKDRRRDQGPNTPWGEGDTPIRETLLLLRDEGWDIPANIEYEYAGGDTLVELRRCLDYCTEVLGADGWRPLFDGTSTAAWRGYKQDALPDGWQVVDGALARVGPAGDIVTVDEFERFELRFEWQVEEGGNSGIFFGVSEQIDGPVWFSGPEYQILHNAGHRDGEAPITSAGSNYGVHPPAADVTRPPGEWNRSRLIVDRGRVEHWMNGTHLLTYDLDSADWQARVAASKFADVPSYGRVRRGRIAIQDHGDPVRFRSIRIRELE